MTEDRKEKAVFLLEDEQPLNTLACEALRDAGFEVIFATDSVDYQKTAVEAIRDRYKQQQNLCAMVVDLWIGGTNMMSGFDVVVDLEKQVPETIDVPLIIWTDNPHPQNCEQWPTIQHRSARHVLVKEGTPQESVAALQHLVEEIADQSD